MDRSTPLEIILVKAPQFAGLYTAPAEKLRNTKAKILHGSCILDEIPVQHFELTLFTISSDEPKRAMAKEVGREDVQAGPVVLTRRGDARGNQLSRVEVCKNRNWGNYLRGAEWNGDGRLE